MNETFSLIYSLQSSFIDSIKRCTNMTWQVNLEVVLAKMKTKSIMVNVMLFRSEQLLIFLQSSYLCYD